MKVLMVIEQCNPEQASVPLLGYRFFEQINKRAEVTLVTHSKNRYALEKLHDNIFYMEESAFSIRYYRTLSPLLNRLGASWPISHALFYPLYSEFNNSVYKRFKNETAKYDIVHAFTPILPRFPYKISQACRSTPFILGPINGGLPFPKGYEDVAIKEGARFNWLKTFAKWLPGYKETYNKASQVLAGSRYTYNEIQSAFPKTPLTLFPENGVSSDFYNPPHPRNKELKLLFVGRLTAYKGGDLLIRALAHVKVPYKLTIIGDGSERNHWERLAQPYNVEFKGWLQQKDIIPYYHASDLFCFPSLREFGGAVVMEAMAASLPCLVVDYGGIGEYVMPDTGFKIPLGSSESIIQALAEKINLLGQDESLRMGFAFKSYEHARNFSWDKRGDDLMTIYQQTLLDFILNKSSLKS